MLKEVRHAVRLLLNRPWFAFVAIGTLALGTGFATRPGSAARTF
jgi:hypothetical protein